MKLTCRACKSTEVQFTLLDGTMPYCEACCPDHDYEYDPDRRGRFCKNCDQRIPDDWYSEDM